VQRQREEPAAGDRRRSDREAARPLGYRAWGEAQGRGARRTIEINSAIIGLRPDSGWALRPRPKGQRKAMCGPEEREEGSGSSN